MAVFEGGDNELPCKKGGLGAKIKTWQVALRKGNRAINESIRTNSP